MQRQQLQDSLVRNLTTLGIKGVPPPQKTLKEYIAEKYGTWMMTTRTKAVEVATREQRRAASKEKHRKEKPKPRGGEFVASECTRNLSGLF